MFQSLRRTLYQRRVRLEPSHCKRTGEIKITEVQIGLDLYTIEEPTNKRKKKGEIQRGRKKEGRKKKGDKEGRKVVREEKERE